MDDWTGDVAMNDSTLSRAPALAAVGSVLWWHVGIPLPEGWLACDGREVSRLAYWSLFSAIGTRFGAGDGKTTFALPDVRAPHPALTPVILAEVPWAPLKSSRTN